jgi:mono/diheme cytochrome c family protein
MKIIACLTLGASLLLPVAVSHAQPMGGPMMGRGMMGGGMMGDFSPRRPYVRRNGLPEAYRNLRSPLAPSAENIRAGKQLFETRCAACHGSSGLGDGPAASQLNPPPTNLQFAVRTPIAGDGYLYWSIAEGGTPIGSAMPPFKSTLEPEAIWQIIAFLRSQPGT